MWCIALRHWNTPFSFNGGRKWTSYFICITYIDSSRSELLTVGERELVHHFLHKEIPSILFWATSDYCDRSHTAYWIVHRDNQIPSMTAYRIQSWALNLAAYEYHIVYKEGRNHGLSGNRLKTKETDNPMPLVTVMILRHIDERPTTCKDTHFRAGKDCFVTGASFHSKRLAR
jgi:hypothetical protein